MMTGQGRVTAEPIEIEDLTGIIKDDRTNRRIPCPETLLYIPPAHAEQRVFPPGCRVLYPSRDPLRVEEGVVESVAIDLTPGYPMEYFYTLIGNHTVAEDLLQFAPTCPVWVKLLHPSSRWSRAVVRGSYQDNEEAAPLYSVQLCEPESGLYHGMSKESINYRSELSAPPIVQSCIIRQEKPTNAGTEETSSSLPEPPSCDVKSELSNHLILRSSIRQATPTVAAKDETRNSTLPQPPSYVKTLRTTSDATHTSPPAATASDESRKRSPSVDHPLPRRALGNAPDNMPLRTSSMDSASTKRAKVAHSAPKVANETQGGTASVALTSQVRVWNPVSISKDTKREQEVTRLSPNATCESDSQENERTIVVSVPNFADPSAIKGKFRTWDVIPCDSIMITTSHVFQVDELIGVNGKRHEALCNQTRCMIRVLNLNSPKRGPKREPIEVEITGPEDRLERAAQLVEDAIVKAVPVKQRGRMLYLLAKVNNYGGSSNGATRLQRSPKDLDTKVWMAVVNVPHDFERDHQSLFISRGGAGIKRITESTKCRHIEIVNGQPSHIFLADFNEKAVNEAVDAVRWRLQWAKKRHEKINVQKEPDYDAPKRRYS